MKLEVNNIVRFRGRAEGDSRKAVYPYGAVVSFNGKPAYVMLMSFNNKVNCWNEQLQHRDHALDIVEVFDGSSIEDVNSVFNATKKNAFDPIALGLPSVWKEQ